MKKFVLFGLVTVIALLNISKVSADQYGCNGQYGQYGSNCSVSTSILIDKTVGKPTSTKGGLDTVQFVDNLSASDYTFKSGNTVYFQLKVKNTSTITLNNVMVTDSLPSYLDAVEGPGNYNSNTKQITFSIDSMNAGEEKTYTIKTVIISQQNLPADKSLICMVNKATVNANNTSDDDTAQLCVGKQVLGVTQVPSTGPEFGIALVSAELVLLSAGIYLNKRS